MAYKNAQSTQFTAVVSTNYVANMPSGVVAGDRLIAHASWDGNNTTAGPGGGWAEIANLDCSVDSSNSRVYEKVAGGSEPSTYTWTNNGQASGVITIYAFSNRGAGASVVGTTKNDGSTGGTGVGTPSTVTALAVTALQGDDLIMLTDLDVKGNADVWAYSAYTAGLDQKAQYTDPATWCRDNVATQDNVSAGTTGDKTCTITRTSGSVNTGWVSVLISIPVSASQTAAPTSDVSAGSWNPSTGATLYGTIDESVASDADYDVCTLTAGSTMEVAFAALSDPASSTGHVIHYRIAGASGQMTVSLRQGGLTEIASWNHNPVPTTLTTYDQTLSSGQADSITDYTDLRLRFVCAP